MLGKKPSFNYYKGWPKTTPPILRNLGNFPSGAFCSTPFPRQLGTKEYENNKWKISAPTWNERIEVPDGSYSVLDIQDYFEYILFKHQTVTDNSPVRIYVSKIENRITFKIKTVYYLERLTPETMKLLQRKSALILNSSAYEKDEYGHLGRWYIKLSLRDFKTETNFPKK